MLQDHLTRVSQTTNLAAANTCLVSSVECPSQKKLRWHANIQNRAQLKSYTCAMVKNIVYGLLSSHHHHHHHHIHIIIITILIIIILILILIIVIIGIPCNGSIHPQKGSIDQPRVETHQPPFDAQLPSAMSSGELSESELKHCKNRVKPRVKHGKTIKKPWKSQLMFCLTLWLCEIATPSNWFQTDFADIEKQCGGKHQHKLLQLHCCRFSPCQPQSKAPSPNAETTGVDIHRCPLKACSNTWAGYGMILHLCDSQKTYTGMANSQSQDTALVTHRFLQIHFFVMRLAECKYRAFSSATCPYP